jgi:hypothetical protein
MTRRQVFDLMRSAYKVRSRIVHGNTPNARDMKVRGTEVPLADFVRETQHVVRLGLREAISRVVDVSGDWPPDWEALILSK